MTDADLIYSACLRAEKRIEERIATHKNELHATGLKLALFTVQTLREEIGNGLSRESR